MTMIKKIKEIDIKISHQMPSLYHHHIINEIMKLISLCGDFGMSWLIIIFLSHMYEPTRQMSIDMLIALIATTLIGQVTIKSIVRRKRPCHSYPDVSLLIPTPSDLSFPSSHTASSFACSTVLFLFYPIAGIIGYIYAFLTAVSRIYLFVHYLSDVVCGMILGISIGTLVFWIC